MFGSELSRHTSSTSFVAYLAMVKEANKQRANR